jgi:nickel-dependent lactate racemase
MHIDIPYGRAHLELQVEERQLIPVHRKPPAPALTDVAAAVRAALETPLGFPALRRALTPDDRVTVVVDEQLPRPAVFLVPVLEHLRAAGVEPDAVTLLCVPPSTGQAWLEDLPDDFEAVHVEVHDPGDRKRLAYLATTRQGRRIYLNRTAVDADQVVVLTRRGYDALLGYAGAAGALFPQLSDAATLAEVAEHVNLAAPGARPGRLAQEAAEVAWLLGSPFFVQVIPGAGDGVAHVLGGLVETCGEGQRLLNARWRVEADAPADTVVAGVGAEGPRFEALAAALTCAARVVKPNGRIVLLTSGEPVLTHDVELLRRAETAEEALQRLQQEKGGHTAAFQWASAARQAKVYLASALPEEVAEELFAVPLDHAGQAQRLIGDGSCLVLADAEKTLTVVRGG